MTFRDRLSKQVHGVQVPWHEHDPSDIAGQFRFLRAAKIARTRSIQGPDDEKLVFEDDAVRIEIDGTEIFRVTASGIQMSGGSAPGGFRRERTTSAQSIPDATITNLEFNGFAFNEVTDFLSWDGTNNEFDVTRDCTATIAGGVLFAANGTGQRDLLINVNNTTVARQRMDAAATGSTALNAASGPVRLSLGNTVSVQVVQNSGASLDAQNSAHTFGAIQVMTDRG